MESLEKVIKQKCKFIGNSKKPYKLYNLGPYSYPTDIRLFLTNMTIESDNIITLLEEMAPLFVYIFSCILHRSGYVHREMHIKIKFPNAIITFEDYFRFDGFHYTTPISTVRDKICEIESFGYCMSFLAPFRVEITLDRHRENIVANYPSEDDVININEIKTYKMDECVICLENKTNVLFCNCGHICVCKKCIEIKRLTKCPVCKTENTTLRIIE